METTNNLKQKQRRIWKLQKSLGLSKDTSSIREVYWEINWNNLVKEQDFNSYIGKERETRRVSYMSNPDLY